MKTSQKVWIMNKPLLNRTKTPACACPQTPAPDTLCSVKISIGRDFQPVIIDMQASECFTKPVQKFKTHLDEPCVSSILKTFKPPSTLFFSRFSPFI